MIAKLFALAVAMADSSMLDSSATSPCATWTQHDLFPPPAATASASELYVVDCLGATNATKLAATTLQGVINSDSSGVASVYLLLAAWDLYWLETLQARGLMPPTSATLTPTEYFLKYEGSYAQCVVFDPALSHTMNVATMVAATDGHTIVVDPTMVATLGKGKKLVDLRGRWKSSVEGYRWALENLYETHKLTQDVLAYYHPYALDQHLRDYLIQQKVCFRNRSRGPPVINLDL